ncbi:MAG: ATP-binding protein [Acidimicrobiales bacterium]
MKTLTSAEHEAVHHLTPATACGRDARGFVRDCLNSWGWPHAATGGQPAAGAAHSDVERAQELQDILLLTSELAINAAEHARSPMDVKVQYWADDLVRVEVHDEGEGKPEAHWPAAFDETGRGLALVELLSESWGVIECAPGKTVWFEFRLH